MQVATANLSKNINKSMGTGVIDNKVLKDTTNNLTQLADAGKKSSKLLGQSFQNMADSGKSNLLSLGEFFKQIGHYITFSIGVQMVMGIKQGLSDAISGFKEFQKAATNAAAVSGYVGGEFQRLEKRIETLSKVMATETVYNANEIAKAFLLVAQAGIDVTKVGKKELMPILLYAQATQADLDSAMQSVLSTMFAYGIELSHTTEVVDAFTEAVNSSFLSQKSLADAMAYVGPIAGELGVSLNETLAALAILSQRGMEGGQAGQRLTMIFTQLLDPTKEAKDMLDGLGLEMEDLDPAVSSLSEILLKLQYAQFGTAEAAKMFRTRTAAAATVLVSNAEDIALLANRYEYATGVTQELADAQATSLWGATQKVTNEIKNLSLEFGESLAPLVLATTTGMRDMLVPVLGAFGKALGFISKNLAVFGNLMKLGIILISAYTARLIVMKIAALGLILVNKLLAAAGAEVVLATELEGAAITELAMEEVVATTTTLTLSTAIRNLGVAIYSSLGIIGIAALVIGGIVGGILAFSAGASDASKSTEKLVIPMTDVVKKMEEMGITADSSNQDFRNLFNTIWAGATTNEEYADILTRIEQEYSKLSGKTFTMNTFYDQGEQGRYLAEATRNVAISQQDLYEIQIALTKSGADGISVMDRYTNSLVSLRDANDDLSDAEQKVSNVMQLHADDTEMISSAQENLIRKQELQNDAYKDYLSASKQVIKVIRSIPGELDFYISKLESAMEAEARRKALLDDQDRVIKNVTESTESYSEAILQYGINSGEAQDALERLNNAIREKIEIDQTISDLQAEYGTNIDIVTNAMKGQFVSMEDVTESVDATIKKSRELSSIEQQLLTDAKDIITSRENMIRLETEYESALNRQKTMESIRADTTKILDEHLRNYYETQNKIYETEYKLYKLRNEEDKQLEDIFDTLAEQGMLTDDIINGYVDMETSQGELLGLNQDYIQTLEDIKKSNPDMVPLIKEYMKTGEGLDSLTGLTQSQIDVITNYKSALDLSKNATNSFGDSMIPLINDLVDMGLVSSETAKGFYEFIDNAGEAAIATEDLGDLQSDIGPTFELIANNVALMANSLIDGTEGNKDFRSVLPKVIKSLGLEGTTLEELAMIMGISQENIGGMKDEQISLALALKKVSSDLGYYSYGMQASSIMENEGIATKERFVEVEGNILQSITDTMLQMPAYTKMVVDATTAYDLWQKEIKIFEQAFLTMANNYDIAVNGMNTNSLEPEVTYQSILDMDTAIVRTTEDWKRMAATMAKNINAELKYSDTDIPPRIPGVTEPIIIEVLPASEIGYTPGGTGGYIPMQFKSMGGIAGLAKGGISNPLKGGFTRGPQLSMIGEKGKEAVIPLEGMNKKYGRDLLEYIIPRYYPDLMKMQTGGVVGGSYDYSTANNENFNVTGPIILQGVQNPDEFGERLRFRMRSSK